MEIISYEYCVYESVDDKSLSWDISYKSTGNRIHATKGYANDEGKEVEEKSVAFFIKLVNPPPPPPTRLVLEFQEKI